MSAGPAPLSMGGHQEMWFPANPSVIRGGTPETLLRFATAILHPIGGSCAAPAHEAKDLRASDRLEEIHDLRGLRTLTHRPRTSTAARMRVS